MDSSINILSKAPFLKLIWHQGEVNLNGELYVVKIVRKKIEMRETRRRKGKKCLSFTTFILGTP